jgi:hypothetical protein
VKRKKSLITFYALRFTLHSSRFTFVSQPINKEPWQFFFLYLVAGAAMGGFLDVAVFREPTPLYGMIGGAIIAMFYQLALWVWQRRRGK